MKYTIEITKRFERDLKKFKKKHYDMNLLLHAVHHLVNDNREILTNNYKDHKLYGKWEGFRELHLESDWLLVYRVDDKRLILTLTRTGTHDDLGLN